MKTGYIIAILFVAALLQSCEKEQLASTIPINETVDTIATKNLTGTFISGPYGIVSGMAEIFNNSEMYEVKLAGFSTSNGPALHVYLSKESKPVNFIDLGILKSTNGNQVYSITGMPDFTDYKYISIHCVQYDHLFGYALLK